MKNVIYIGLLILSLAGIYGLYFNGVNNILNLPSNPLKLTHHRLSKGNAYFKISNQDSSQIKVFKYVGSVDNGQKQVICYQYPITLKDHGKSFVEAVNNITKTQSKFLFDYTHPINNDTLEVVSDFTIKQWLSDGSIMYLMDNDYRDDFFNHSSFLSKAFSFFYLYPLGHIVWVIMLIFILRISNFLLQKIPHNFFKAIVVIMLLSSVFILIGYLYVDNSSYSISYIIAQIFIISMVYYIVHRIQKSGLGFLNKEVLKFYTIVLLPVTISLMLGFVPLLGDRNNTFMANLSINLLGVALILYSLLAGIPFAIAHFINNFIDYTDQKKQNLYKLELQKKNADYKAAEIDSLMSRMNPHFLFNGLNAICSLISSDGKKAESMALGLANFYKYASNRENKIYTSLKEEMDLLQHYLAVEKMRFGNALQTSIDVDEHLSAYKIPYMILQPLAENAIKYGYNVESKSVHLTITIKEDKDNLNICVYDEGKAFDHTLQHGFGLHSLNRKLELLYDGNYKLQFINSPRKCVFLQLPKMNTL